MAPRKASTPAKPAKKSNTKDSNKVAKRPARGYHKYKNGQLNVTPKGSEIDLVKENQNSPLLCLPPEIRNRIWDYTLGHNTFRARPGCYRSRRIPRLTLAPDEPGINVAILRSCRQIYSETALMPVQLNTLAFSVIGDIVSVARRLKLHQRKQITTIRFEVSDFNWERFCSWEPKIIENVLARTFPAVNHIEVEVDLDLDPFDLSDPDDSVTLEEAERGIRQHYQLFLAEASVRMTLKGLAEPMPKSCYNL
ncbi:hypothetical protein EJ07DRAFT_177226 [Lizonia empirigonia]|nr:hypothetical protein EJ07DRAFT_177226 [Lizonia empirigonia]